MYGIKIVIILTLTAFSFKLVKGLLPGDPFGPVRARDYALWDCRSSGPGLSSPIPKRPNCTAISHRDKTRVEGQVTIWKIDTSLWKVEACECFSETVTATCVSPLFGLESKSTKREFSPANYTYCLQSCLDIDSGSLTQSEIHGVIVSGKDPEYDCPMWGTRSVIVTITSVMRLTLIVDHDSDVMTGAVNFARPCKYNETKCPTVKGGFVFWKQLMKPSDRCNLKATGLSEICSLHGDTELSIHCPLTKAIYHLGHHQIIPTVACSWVGNESKIDVYKTLEGVWISGRSKAGGNLVDWIKTHQQGDQSVVFTQSSPKTNGSHILGLTGPQLAWLEDSWVKKSSEERSYLELQLCREAQHSWDLAWNLRHIAPMAAASIWTKTPHTISTLFSGFVLSWPCKEVYQYRFLKNENCSENWPIEYSDGIAIHTGFLEPVSYRITQRRGRMSCRISPGFLFRINDSHVVNLATRDFSPVPESYFAVDPVPVFHSHVFYSPSLYSVEELGGQSQYETLVELHHDHLRQAIYALSNSHEISTDEKLDALAPIDKATSIIGHYLGSTMDKILNSITLVITLVILLMTIVYVAKCFCTCYFTPFNCIKYARRPKSSSNENIPLRRRYL